MGTDRGSDGRGGATVPDPAIDDTVLPDSAIDDTVLPDSGIDDTVLPDSGIDDTVLPDSGTDDTVLPDSGTDDTVSADGSLGETALPPSGASTSGAAAKGERSALIEVPPSYYTIREELARGGMGSILDAEDIRTGRRVALKEVRRELLSRYSRSQREALLLRFEREARITARLQHPGIVPVYEVGRFGDRPFYSMKLVEGRPLDQVIADAPTLDDRLALLPNLLAVAEAMAYAHERGIVHRDLKPANVLVGEYGETVVVDWGLAKDLASTDDDGDAGNDASLDDGGDELATVAGSVLGTPHYMPPEQAAGQAVDARADVYSLGAILYQLMTGRTPYVASEDSANPLGELLASVINEAPQPVRTVEPRVPADLVSIIDKAMAREPGERYPSAVQLANDLRQYQTGQLVGTHEYSFAELTKRWLRQHRGAVIVATVAILILAIGGSIAITRIVREGNRAAAGERAAKKQEAEAKAQGKEATRQAAKARARTLLFRSRQYAASSHTAEEMAVLRALATLNDAGGRELAVLEGGMIWKANQRMARGVGTVGRPPWRSGDGKRLFVKSDDAVQAVDATTGKLIRRLAAKGAWVAGVSPHGKWLVLGHGKTSRNIDNGVTRLLLSKGSQVHMVNVDTGETMLRWSNRSVATGAVAFANDDSAVAIWRYGSGHGGVVRVFRAGGKVADLRIGKCQGDQPLVAVSREAKYVATWCGVATSAVQVHEVATKQVRPLKFPEPLDKTWREPQQLFDRAIAFVAGGSHLVVVGSQMTVFEAASGRVDGQAHIRADRPVSGSNMPKLNWKFGVSAKGQAFANRIRMPRVRMGTKASSKRFAINLNLVREGPRGQVLILPTRYNYDTWRPLNVRLSKMVRPPVGGNRAAHLSGLLARLQWPTRSLERCIARDGNGTQHAFAFVDHGGRAVVGTSDVSLTPPSVTKMSAWPVPYRFHRPALAADEKTCLVWEHVRPLARQLPGWDGRQLTASPLGALAYTTGKKSSTRVWIPGIVSPRTYVGGSPRFSPGGHLLSTEGLSTFRIVDVSSGKVSHEIPTNGGASYEWRSSKLMVFKRHGKQYALTLLPDGKTTSRALPPGALTRLGSPYFLTYDKATLRWHELATGKNVGSHKLAKAKIELLPGKRGAVAVLHYRSGALLYPDGSKRNTGYLVDVSSDDARYVGIRRKDQGYDIVDLEGRGQFTVPRIDAGAFNSSAGYMWGVSRTRKPTLHRWRLADGAHTNVPLRVDQIPFSGNVRDFRAGPKGEFVSASYRISDRMNAVAMWRTNDGALVWFGNRRSKLAPPWVGSEQELFRPTTDLRKLIRDTGARTNFRVCRNSFDAVAVEPPPPPESVWAPASACTNTGSSK